MTAKKLDYPIVKKSFIIIVFLLFLFGILGHIFMPDEREKLKTNCHIFQSSWEQIMENGQRIPVAVPSKIEAEYGEVVTVATTLPQEIYYGECLAFRPIWQDIKIYIDGELRTEYSTDNSRPFGKNSAMRYVFVELQESDAGKELTYQFVSESKYAGEMRESYMGDRLSIWMYLLKDSGLHMFITIFLLIMSIFCIIVCIILQFVCKKELALIYLAWTLFFSAFWMMSEVAFRQILIKNVSVLSNYTYWCLMIIPIPLLLFMDDMQNHRYKKLYSIPILYSISIFVIGTFLQVFNIVEFVQQLPFIHGGLLCSILFIIITITIDTFKGKLMEYLSVGIGVYGMLLTAIIEIALYYIGTNLSLGTVLAIGLLFLLVMAIIKTGQDLLQSEKIQQQAITAREAQSKFLANMSHEIRTPINAIIGMNEMILRESENEVVSDYAHNIQNASTMLLGLINDVLDFSKIESGQLELVEDNYHLATIIHDEMLLLNARTAGKAISTKLEVDPKLPSQLYGDELRIKQVLTNLLSNAAKYTQSGTITLKADFSTLDNDRIMLSFSVIDTGIGIKEDDLSKLFDSFKRLELDKNRAIQGTGLGLNIAKQLIDQMQGNIVVKSVYGKGSTFTIYIPQKVIDNQPIDNIEESISKRKKETKSTDNRFTAEGASILVVDDNAMNLTLMKGLLKRTKMHVDVAESGKKCLELTKSNKYNIIFMDHMMPEMDGVETLRELRKENSNPNKDTIVIALTANAVAGCREMYLDYGFNDYFPKPVQADKLDALLIEHLPKELVSVESASKSESSNQAKPKTTSQDEPQNISSDLLEIDRALGISYCMDSEDFYEEILGEFCSQAKKLIQQIDTYFQNEDWINYAVIAHSIKGSALNIGASNFSKLSLEHELAGKEGNSDFIKANYSGYIEALKELINKIERVA